MTGFNEPIDFDLVARYLAGACAADEGAAFERWLASHPERRELIEGLRAVWAAGPELARRDGVDPDALADRIVQSAARTRGGELRLRKSEPPRAPRIWRAAGAIAATFVAATLGIWVLRAPRVNHASRATSRAFATARGERQAARLPDGTRVVLGPASVLRIPSDFSTSARTVDLEGEALFTVVHDAAHPFAVRTSTAIATDIGTEFDVRSYADDRDVRVAVVEGRVGVAERAGRDNASETISAGDVATISESGVAVTRNSDVATLTAWAQGRLIFDRTPLRDAVQDLARTFDMDITVSDSSLLDRRLTGAFGDDEPVDEVLNAVALSVGGRVERVGRYVVIRRGLAGLIRTDSETPAQILRTAHATRAE